MNTNKRKFIAGIFSILGAALVLFMSCASKDAFASVDNELERNGYESSIEQLEKKRGSLYRNRDSILYFLDRGMLSHYAKDYAVSSQLLQEGERAIEEAFTKSVTQNIATYLVNDNTREYGGEDYEDIYINAFNALNYYHRGEPEGAMVEIRRMNNKLDYLTTKYDAAISDLQKKALEDEISELPPNPQAPEKFSDSALARYLGMLFFRGNGRNDDARIDRDHLLAAFANTPAVYTYPVPSTISGELNIPDGMARLNVIAFGGRSPIKKEVVIRIPLPGARWIKIALPEMQSRPSAISRIELVFESGESHAFELLEDIDAVARETFKVRQQLIYLKTIIRAIVKSASSSALQAAGNETGGDTGLVLGLASIAAQAFAEVSEQADIRLSRYFPAKAYIAAVNLPPGQYSFQIKYYGINGREIASVSHNGMDIREKALNLAEAVCLR